MNVGIIGYGTLGRALAMRWRDASEIDSLFATGRSRPAQSGERPEPLSSNGELVRRSDVVVLSVKPAQVRGVLAEIAGDLDANRLLVSTAAGVTLQNLEAWSGGACAVVRAMPNLGARTGDGMTVVAHGGTGRNAVETARTLFERVGRVVELDEQAMDAATALSGCGPAYVCAIADALAEGGVRLGLPRSVAIELTLQTLLGTARVLLESGTHPAVLKDEVTTPGGCAIAGLAALEAGGVRVSLANAVVAAARRAAELAG